jgi:polyisoprenoid-binding protein YceI
MSRILAFVLIVIAFGAGVGAGVLGILYSTGGLAEPSRDVAEMAPTLSMDGPTPTPGEFAIISTQNARLESKVDALATQIAAGAVAAAAEAEPTSEPEAAAADAEVPERALYRITQDESEARFMIEETFMDNPNTVVGATRRVAGDIIINFSDPPASQVGTIAINARTFKTDQEFRDQSLRGQILESSSDDYEFINFVPTALQGLPTEPVGVGSTVTFQIEGDLTIKDVTRSVVFDASVTVVAEDRIEGLASTEVLYSDFGITINPPPTVSDIGDEVTLELDLVALREDA